MFFVHSLSVDMLFSNIKPVKLLKATSYQLILDRLLDTS